MGKMAHEMKSSAHAPSISKKSYKDSLRQLQIELVKLQRHFIKCNDKILIILEGRDASGKDGTIKRIVQHLSPRETRAVALGKPWDRDRASWYFQRYVPHLPAAQELALFNRSWYNRAGVERVMGFCTAAEHEEFMGSVSLFENMLARSGVKLRKYYLDISKAEQKRRLRDRKTDPLKQWKVSPIHDQAINAADPYRSVNRSVPKGIGEQIMKQTTEKIEAMKSIFGDASVERQINRGDGVVREDANFLSGTATVRAMEHEGHVMPSSPTPPAVKPAKENIKPKAPPTPPTAKPPAKRAQSRLRATRSHRGRWVRADIKRLVQLNIVKDLLGRHYYAGRDERLMRPDPQIVFAYDFPDLENGQLAN